MKRYRTVSLLTALLLLLTAVLAACGGGGTGSTNTGSGTGAGQPATGVASTAPSPAGGAAASPTTGGSSGGATGGATKITLVDTNSGANFQEFFQTYIVPQAKKDLGVDIDYVVSSGPELLQRLKAAGSGKGDIDLMLTKTGDIADMVEEGIKMEKVYPDKKSEIPNISKNPQDALKTAQGVDINGQAALFWRSQYALIYNSDKIKNPPKSWKEFFDRRQEFKGKIGYVRPDAKSSGGRAFTYTALKAFGVDMSKPFSELEKSKEWKDAWNQFGEFSKYFHDPIASEPPLMFDMFKKGEVDITVYAMDYSLWTRDKGLLPPSTKAGFLSEGLPAGSDAYLSVPANASPEAKATAYKVMNWLLSDPVQTRMVTQMWQYPGTEIWDKLPADVWNNIPKWDAVKDNRVLLNNKDVVDYIKENGAKQLKK